MEPFLADCQASIAADGRCGFPGRTARLVGMISASKRCSAEWNWPGVWRFLRCCWNGVRSFSGVEFQTRGCSGFVERVLIVARAQGAPLGGVSSSASLILPRIISQYSRLLIHHDEALQRAAPHFPPSRPRIRRKLSLP